MAKIIYIFDLPLFYIILSTLYAITSSLPVTSKPIENTPEHLAWEAWIMVPSSHDKVRKITPKSIFIVPNGSNNGGINGNDNFKKDPIFMSQTQCPPGHTFDNYKCIPTVSIDQSQILITRLTNLVHSTDKYNGSDSNLGDDYDINYEYDAYETDESQNFENPGIIRNDNQNPSSLSLSSLSSSSSSDYNGEPLKINLSLEKFSSNENNEKNGTIEENIKNHPLREQDSPLSTNSTQATTSKIKKSDDNNNNHTNTTSLPSAQSFSSTITLGKFNSSDSDEFSILHPRTVTNNNTFKNFPILSPSETEMLTTTSNTNSSKPKDTLDYDLDDSSTSTSRTTISDDEMELVTTFDEIKTTNFKDDLEKDSLITEQINTNTATASSTDGETTETEEQISATTPLDQFDDDKTDATLFEESVKLTEILKGTDSESTLKESSNNISSQISHNANTNNTNSKNLHRDAAPLMETVESNNHFIYHHLNTNTLNSTSHQQIPLKKIETTTVSSDIREQLRIINQIVEENKKRAKQSSKIRFPDDNENNHNSPNHYQNRYDNVRSDFVKFPTDTTLSSSPIALLPTRYKPSFNPSSFDSTSTSSSQQLISSSAYNNIRKPNTSNFQPNSKPFWWLPTGWEVDRTGDRPMMVHFWSRIPIESYTNLNSGISGKNNLSTLPISTSAAGPSTTTRYRENSKSPTENLYKQDIFTHQKHHHDHRNHHHYQQNPQQHQQHQHKLQLQQQKEEQYQQQQDNIYSVLGTKQWKHNNR